MIKYITPSWSAPNTIAAFSTLRSNLSIQEMKKDVEEFTGKPIAWIDQTHSNRCSVVKDKYYPKNADATASYSSQYACAVITADCVPILLTDQSASFISAIHAGWKGIASGVIEQTLQNIRSKDIIAWIGPAICAKCYYVKDDFEQVFKSKGFESCFSNTKKKTFNLKKACKIILKKYNVAQIYESPFCTSCDNDLFFSARKEGIESGRIITCIWKKH